MLEEFGNACFGGTGGLSVSWISSRYENTGNDVLGTNQDKRRNIRLLLSATLPDSCMLHRTSFCLKLLHYLRSHSIQFTTEAHGSHDTSKSNQ